MEALAKASSRHAPLDLFISIVDSVEILRLVGSLLEPPVRDTTDHHAGSARMDGLWGRCSHQAGHVANSIRSLIVIELRSSQRYDTEYGSYGKLPVVPPGVTLYRLQTPV